MSEEWHKTHAVLRERCEYVFEYTGNRCQLEKGHPAGEHKWYASHENEAILMRQQNAQPEMTSLRDIRQKLEALVEMRADDERWRGVALEAMQDICGLLKKIGERSEELTKEYDERRKADDDERAMLIARDTQRFMELSGKIEAIGNCLAGLLTLGAKPSTKRKPRGRRK
jgi:hypothetical protein